MRKQVNEWKGNNDQVVHDESGKKAKRKREDGDEGNMRLRQHDWVRPVASHYGRVRPGQIENPATD